MAATQVESRLQTAGMQWIKLHLWAISEVGLAGAGVLGFLDFQDQREPAPNLPTASAADVVAALQGLVGRGKVYEGLSALLGKGWVEKHEDTIPGEKNLKTFIKYSLNSHQVNEFLQKDTPGVPILARPARDDSGPENGTLLLSNKNCRRKAALQKEKRAAAPFLATDDEKRRPPRRTAHGLECWYRWEDAAADKLEAETPGGELAAAVAEVRAEKNEAKNKKSPTPAAVQDKLDERAARRAAAAVVAEQERQDLATASAEAERKRVRDAALQAFLHMTPASKDAILARFAASLPPQMLKDYRARGIDSPSIRAALPGYLIKHAPPP